PVVLPPAAPPGAPVTVPLGPDRSLLIAPAPGVKAEEVLSLLSGGAGVPGQPFAPPLVRGRPTRGGDTFVFVLKTPVVLSGDRDFGPPRLLGTLKELVVDLEMQEGDLCRVTTFQGDGWVRKQELLTAEEAVAFFSVRLAADPKDAEALARRGTAHGLL